MLYNIHEACTWAGERGGEEDEEEGEEDDEEVFHLLFREKFTALKCFMLLRRE